MFTTPTDTIVSFFNDHSCSHVLIQYMHMHCLKGVDVVHYFNDKRVIPKWVFNFLLACIRHDDIVHKIDATDFRIFVSPNFYVSHYSFLIIAQLLYISPYITNNRTHLCTILSITKNRHTCF
jgi:hypothetical protein